MRPPARVREVCEGSIARTTGHDIDENVYVEEFAAASYELWRLGWEMADALLEREWQLALAQLDDEEAA